MTAENFNIDVLCEKLQTTPIDPDTIKREDVVSPVRAALVKRQADQERARQEQYALQAAKAIKNMQRMQAEQAQGAQKTFASYKKWRDSQNKG